MPPAIPVGTASGTVGADAITFVTPATAKPRDSLIAVVATLSTNDGPDLDADDADGWEQLASFVGATNTVWVLRREAQPEDTGNISIPFLEAISDPAIGALLVYRNLNTGAAAVESGRTNISASTNFVCPARTLAAYSDLYLGIVLVTTAALAVSAASGCTERIEVHGTGLTLEVFDLLAEATGTTGTKTAHPATAQSGIAASILLAADPFVGFGKEFSFEPVGAIGLPSRGV